MMHKVLRSTALGILALAGVTACGDKVSTSPGGGGTTTTSVQSVLVTPNTVNLNVGETVKLVATVVGDTASVRKGVTWSSSDQTKATVDPSGNVTAKGPGTVVITATSQQDATKQGTATVVVANQAQNRVRAVAVQPSAASIRVGEQVRLIAAVTADPGVATTVRWISSDSTKVRIDQTGVATGRAPGTVVVQAISTADSTMRGLATIVVNSTQGSVQSVSITPSTLNLTVGQTSQFVALVNASDSTVSRAVTFRSNDTTIVSVDNTGRVTARAAGTAVVTAISVADTTRQAAAAVIVAPQAGQTVRSITVQPNQATTQIGQAVTFVATVSADTGVSQANRAVIFSVSDTTRASIAATSGQTAVVTPRAAGTVVVLAKSVINSQVVGTATLVILAPGTTGVTQVQLVPQSATLRTGDSLFLAATVVGDSTVRDRTVTYATTNANIATVNATTGLVRAVSVGTAVITATSNQDPTKQATATIVVQAVSSTSVTIGSLTTATGAPLDVTNVNGTINANLQVVPGSNQLNRVALVLSCPGNGGARATDTVAVQTFQAGQIPAGSTNPVPVSFNVNTAAFNAATGQVNFVNGSCTLNAVAFTTNPATGAANAPVTATSQAVTLTNQDLIVVTGISITNTNGVSNPQTDPAGQPWNQGTVTVTLAPLAFSGRTLTGATVGLFNNNAATSGVDFRAGGAGALIGTSAVGNTPTAPAAIPPGAVFATAAATLSNGLFTATFPVSNAGPSGINNVTVPGASVFVTSTNNLGNAGPSGVAVGVAQQQNPATGAGISFVQLTPTLSSSLGGATTGFQGNFFRLDNTPPAPAAFTFATQGAANNFIGPNFQFTTAAGNGFTAAATSTVGGVVFGTNDWGGVDRTTATTSFFYGAAGTACSAATTAPGGGLTQVTSATGIPESASTTSYTLCIVEADALGNKTFTAFGPFGVDVTPPTFAPAGGPASGTGMRGGSFAGTNFVISNANFTDNLSGTNQVYEALVRQAPGLATPANGAANAGNGSYCAIGTFTTALSSSVPGALPVYNTTGTQIGTCVPIAVGGPAFPALSPTNGNGGDGYYTISLFGTDVAGNRSAVVTRSFVQDATAPTTPTISSIPSTYPSGGSVAISGSVGDNLDVADAGSYLRYPNLGSDLFVGTTNAGGMLQMAGPNPPPLLVGPAIAAGLVGQTTPYGSITMSPIGRPFDNVLTTSASATVTLQNLITSMQTTTATGNPVAPAGGTDRPTQFTLTDYDEVGLLANQPFAFGTLGGSFTGTNTNFSTPAANPAAGPLGIETFLVSTNAANIRNCPAAGCPGGAAVNPSSVTFTATVANSNAPNAPTTTAFVNPFGRVDFIYCVATNTAAAGGTCISSYYYAGSTSSSTSSATANGAGRQYQFSLTFTPPPVTPDNQFGLQPSTNAPQPTFILVRALGVSGGSALASPAAQTAGPENAVTINNR